MRFRSTVDPLSQRGRNLLGVLPRLLSDTVDPRPQIDRDQTRLRGHAVNPLSKSCHRLIRALSKSRE